MADESDIIRVPRWLFMGLWIVLGVILTATTGWYITYNEHRANDLDARLDALERHQPVP